MDNKWIRLTVVIMFVAALVGCNMPVSVSVETGQDKEVTPDLTMTALFAPSTVEVPADSQPELIVNTVEAAAAAPEEPAAPTIQVVEENQEPTKEQHTATVAQADPGTSGGGGSQDNSGSGTSPDVNVLPAMTDTAQPTGTTIPEIVVQAAADTATPTSTATSTPTTTSTVTPTHTPPGCDRAIGRYEADYMSSGPTLDGYLNDWNTTTYSIPYVVYGVYKWAGNFDLYGTFQLGWNGNYLYIAARVEDDRYVQLSNSWEIYKGDSLDILFDADLCGDFMDKELSADDYQIGISPGYIDKFGIKDAYRWFPRPPASLGSIVTYSSRDNYYTYYETQIPWSVFGITNPGSGDKYGMALSVSDNDDAEVNMQESMISMAAHRAFNPMTWPMLYLK